MTEVLAVPHPGHRVAPKVQETRHKGHWLQDNDTDSLEFDKLLAELQSFPEEHNAKGLYQNGFSDDAGLKEYEVGTEAETRVHCLTPSKMGLRLRQLNDSSKERKQLESNDKNMPVLESVGTNKNIQHRRSFSQDSQWLEQNVPSVEKISDKVVESKNPKCDSGQKNKLQVDMNTIKSKSQTLAISSSLVNGADRGKPAVVFSNTAPAVTFSLAELAKQHKSQRARVATLESGNKKLNKQSMPLVLGCSTSPGSLTDLPAAYPQRAAATSSGVSLSQLALQHRHSKSPLSTVSPGNGYINGYKPSLLQLMKNVAIDDTKTSTAAEAPRAKVPSKETTSSLSLTSCLKVNKPSERSTKLPYGQQKQDTEDSAVSNTFVMMDSQSVQPDADSQDQDIPTDLIPQVSSVGFVLCCLKRKRKLEDSSANVRKTLKYPKFKCVSQVGHRIVYPEIVYRRIEPFDFSTPSPDDLVKHKQKQAFTRPQKEFEF